MLEIFDEWSTENIQIYLNSKREKKDLYQLLITTDSYFLRGIGNSYLNNDYAEMNAVLNAIKFFNGVDRIFIEMMNGYVETEEEYYSFFDGCSRRMPVLNYVEFHKALRIINNKIVTEQTVDLKRIVEDIINERNV